MSDIKEFNLDIVYVIDATGNGAIIDNVKSGIAEYGEKLAKFCKDKFVRPVKTVREKLVFFGDFAMEGKNAIIETEFYDSATQKTEFLKQLDRDDVRMSGGDMPENGLEALYTAMKSDFCKIDLKNGINGRHVIVLISDAYPLKLGERKGCFGYDADAYPADIEKLKEVWDLAGYPQSEIPLSEFKRLVMYVPEGRDPNGHTWDDAFFWTDTCICPIQPNMCGADADLFHEGIFSEIAIDNNFRIY